MKPFLGLITTLLVSTPLTPIVSHNFNQKTTVATNFYVLGDSLSDTGALAGAGTQFFKASSLLFPNIKEVRLAPPYYNNSFSNGPVAAQIIANKLGVKLTPGWKFRDLLFRTHQQVGNNYAVGGAQASNQLDVEGLFINKFDLNSQVDALLSQHSVKKNDKIFLEIGGNDIMYAITEKFKVMQDIIIDDAISNEKKALKKLITKGENHILVSNLPDFSVISKFNKDPSTAARVGKLISMFNNKWTVMINSLNKEYNNPIKPYSLFDGLKQAINTFKKQDVAHNISDSAVTTDFSQLLKTGILTPKYNPGVDSENVKNYFYFDGVHPTKWGHNFIANQLLKLIENW